MITAVVGANWGDEGKGKITDRLAQDADYVVRFQGGSNAGHTIKNEWGKFALHLLPSGIFSKDAVSVIGKCEDSGRGAEDAGRCRRRAQQADCFGPGASGNVLPHAFGCV